MVLKPLQNNDFKTQCSPSGGSSTDEILGQLKKSNAWLSELVSILQCDKLLANKLLFHGRCLENNLLKK